MTFEISFRYFQNVPRSPKVRIAEEPVQEFPVAPVSVLLNSTFCAIVQNYDLVALILAPSLDRCPADTPPSAFARKQ